MLVHPLAHEPAVAHDGRPGDDRVAGGDRPAAQPGLDRVGEGAGERDAVERPARRGRRPRPAASCADLARRGRGSRPPPRVAISSASRRRHGLGPVAQPAEQQRVAGLHPQRRRVGRRRAVAADPDRHAGGPQLGDRGDAAAADHQVRARAVGHADARGAEPGDLVRRSGRRSARPTSGRCPSRRPRSARSVRQP